jgi:hypothetical protein
MGREPTSSYVQSAGDTVDRGCDHCDWYAVADSYPVLVKRYQDHLRDDHPRAWMRS